MKESGYVWSYQSDSESYETDWTFRMDNENYLKHKRPKENSKDFPILKFHRKDVPSFGNYVERYDWIECVSKSVPGRLYYYNLRSGCSTWKRPISRYVHIPCYSRVGYSCCCEQRYRSNWTDSISNDDEDYRCLTDKSHLKLQEINLRKEWTLDQLYYAPRRSQKKKENASRLQKILSNDNKERSLSDSFSSDCICLLDDSKMVNLENIDTRDDSPSRMEKTLLVDVNKFVKCKLSESSEFERCVDSSSMKATIIENIYKIDKSDGNSLLTGVDDKHNDQSTKCLVPRLERIDDWYSLSKNMRKKGIERWDKLKNVSRDNLNFFKMGKSPKL